MRKMIQIMIRYSVVYTCVLHVNNLRMISHHRLPITHFIDLPI
jgi:hypothetical protein